MPPLQRCRTGTPTASLVHLLLYLLFRFMCLLFLNKQTTQDLHLCISLCYYMYYHYCYYYHCYYHYYYYYCCCFIVIIVRGAVLGCPPHLRRPPLDPLRGPRGATASVATATTITTIITITITIIIITIIIITVALGASERYCTGRSVSRSPRS